MADVIRAVAYARFSSDGQRDESIDAQLRAIQGFAENNGYTLLKSYIDRGISGTTDNRPEFMRMIDDARSGNFDVIIVHKLDRFARNRADSAIYRRELERQGVSIVSVLENFDNSPESIILQSVIEGYNEYYSRNLRREVMKGLRENALTCRHTGGRPCLGYDVDKDTQKYVINPFEARAVKLIFKMYLEGEGYTAIINELNSRGYKTKLGNPFGKNSLYEVLRNERYTGIYIYNKTASAKSGKTANRHAYKPEEDIIRIEGGVPQIISKEDFQKVQEKMNQRRRDKAKYRAKQEYLLSGKVVCGDCGNAYAGNARKAGAKGAVYISYTCTKRNGKAKCSNKGINRDLLEQIVLDHLADKVFSEDILPEIIKRYNDFALSKNKDFVLMKDEIKAKIADTEKGISNIVDIVVATGSPALVDKLKELETTKAQLEHSLMEAEQKISDMTINPRQLKAAFKKAKQQLRTGDLKNKKSIVQQYVKQVTIHPNKVIMEFKISDLYTITEEVER